MISVRSDFAPQVTFIMRAFQCIWNLILFWKTIHSNSLFCKLWFRLCTLASPSVLEYEAISNTPRKWECLENGWKTTTFQTTPVMSTYLLAIVISDFAHKEVVLENGYDVSQNVNLNDVSRRDIISKVLLF